MHLFQLLTTLISTITVTAFHYYVDSAEVKCFVEELTAGTEVFGAYKVLIFNSTTKKYEVQDGAMMKISVESEESEQTLVDTTSPGEGKFKFTGADDGFHKICL
jgi:hypothetical protein